MDIGGDGVVLIRGRDPIVMLRSRFPDFFASLPFHVDNDEPYFAYETFADHLRQRRTDEVLWDRACSLFDDIAAKDPSLHELLSVAVFDPLCSSPELSFLLKSKLGPAAQKLIDEIEQF
ncbi:MAG: hypothetical protein HYX27_15455 [Acidobacteria bacterium]|nr:hypothetical protein [Acidobacteriota bacterium]